MYVFILIHFLKKPRNTTHRTNNYQVEKYTLQETYLARSFIGSVFVMHTCYIGHLSSWRRRNTECLRHLQKWSLFFDLFTRFNIEKVHIVGMEISVSQSINASQIFHGIKHEYHGHGVGMVAGTIFWRIIAHWTSTITVNSILLGIASLIHASLGIRLFDSDFVLPLTLFEYLKAIFILINWVNYVDF